MNSNKKTIQPSPSSWTLKNCQFDSVYLNQRATVVMTGFPYKNTEATIIYFYRLKRI